MGTVNAYMSKSYERKSGKYPIYLTFYIARKKLVIATGVSVPESDFDSKSGKIKASNKDYKDLNLIIGNTSSRINNILVRYRLKNITPTRDRFLRDYKKNDDYTTFFEYYQDYHKSHKNSIELTTLATHNTVLSKLESYCPNLHFDDITEDFIDKYKWYLKKELKNKDSTAGKNLKVIKKYVRAAIRDGYISKDPFECIRIKRNFKTDFSYLNEAELQKMVDLYKSGYLPERRQQVLEFFLFMCFTSLNIGDAKLLKIDQIGEKNLTYYRIKNRNSKPEAIVVPLSSPARLLIRKIKKRRVSGYLFINLISDQKIRENIKKIAEQLEIKKNISPKSARHTFATIFLKRTKDMATLREIMGHTDYRETLIYAHVLDESKQSGIKAFDDFM